VGAIGLGTDDCFHRSPVVELTSATATEQPPRCDAVARPSCPIAAAPLTAPTVDRVAAFVDDRASRVAHIPLLPLGDSACAVRCGGGGPESRARAVVSRRARPSRRLSAR
jgi:hypothetical protein